jgi:pimeloyl-ACP methyl ester carboxylesterase
MSHRRSFHSLRTRGVALAVVASALALVFGPRERFQERWSEPALSDDLGAWIEEEEGRVANLRPGDEKEIVWAGGAAGVRTPLALVYVHGFSADRHEIEPVLSALAADHGANVFFTRLTGHGRDGAAMAEATVEAWLDDAAEAVAIGERIGERVVLVGTSTGGTLATWAAARPEAADRIAGLVLISPNFQPKDRSSRVFLYPWGGQLARLLVGPERCFTPENEEQERHWTTCYPTTVLRTMMALVERVRTMDLSTVSAPTLVLYSSEDQVVEPAETLSAVRRMTGTTPTLYEVTTTIDPARHVLAGDIVSPTSAAEVSAVLGSFLDAIESEGAEG